MKEKIFIIFSLLFAMFSSMNVENKVVSAADQYTLNHLDYYANVDTSLTGEAFLQNLTSVISKNTKGYSYSGVWDILKEADEDPTDSNYIKCFYTGYKIHKNNKATGGSNSNDYYNREHVWPKSHGFPDEAIGPYTDCHHLHLTGVEVNAKRGHLDFDEVNSPTYTAGGCKVNGTNFEPRDEVKGDVARSVFYMMARYNDSSTFDLNVVDKQNTSETSKIGELGKLSTLIKWHFQDPVSAEEQKRNEVVYKYQNNYNPFIDNPDYLRLVYPEETKLYTYSTSTGLPFEDMPATESYNQQNSDGTTTNVTIFTDINYNDALNTWNADKAAKEMNQGGVKITNGTYTITSNATYTNVSQVSFIYRTQGGSGTITTSVGSTSTKKTIVQGSPKELVFDYNPAKHGQIKFVLYYGGGSFILDKVTFIYKDTNIYTVSFDSQGGSSITPQMIEENACATRPSDPTRTKYNFIDWYTELSYINAYNFDTPVTKDITLYAKWEEIIYSYTVNFNTYDGSPVDSIQVNENQTITRPEDPYKNGYIFKGWYTSISYTTEFDFSTPITGNRTLYAKWELYMDEPEFNFGFSYTKKVTTETVVTQSTAGVSSNPASEIVSGKKYSIVAKISNTSYYSASAPTASNATSISVKEGSVPAGDGFIFTNVESNIYTISTEIGSTTYYLAKGSNNAIKYSNTNTADASKWKISSNTSGECIIENVGKAGYHLVFNKNASMFRNYSGKVTNGVASDGYYLPRLHEHVAAEDTVTTKETITYSNFNNLTLKMKFNLSNKMYAAHTFKSHGVLVAPSAYVTTDYETLVRNSSFEEMLTTTQAVNITNMQLKEGTNGYELNAQLQRIPLSWARTQFSVVCYSELENGNYLFSLSRNISIDEIISIYLDEGYITDPEQIKLLNSLREDENYETI